MNKSVYLLIIVICSAISFLAGKYVFVKKDEKGILLYHTSAPFNLTDNTAEGNEKGLLTLIEFGNLECPYSVRFHKVINKLLHSEKYKDKIKYYFKNYPFRKNEDSILYAKAILAAGMQGKSVEMRESLFEKISSTQKREDKGSSSIIQECIKELNVDKVQFDIDLESEEIMERLTIDIEDGRKHFVFSTPSIFVNGYLVKGALDITKLHLVIEKILTTV
jgi:protein-disulfide isomerase